LHDDLGTAGFCVGAGDLGENVTTRGVDLLGLPTGTKTGVMGVVRADGDVRPGDPIRVVPPRQPHRPLERV
jgi:MOSC domain-containing protein YiiM